MKPDFIRNTRLVVATVLLSLWGYGHLAGTPVLGESVIPLVAALLIAPGSPLIQWRGARLRALVAIVFVLAITALLYHFGSAQALTEFARNPYFVLPVWVLGLIGLVRNATSAERLEVAANAGHAPEHAVDAGWVDVPPPSAEGAPASWSVRKRS